MPLEVILFLTGRRMSRQSRTVLQSTTGFDETRQFREYDEDLDEDDNVEYSQEEINPSSPPVEGDSSNNSSSPTNQDTTSGGGGSGSDLFSSSSLPLRLPILRRRRKPVNHKDLDQSSSANISGNLSSEEEEEGDEDDDNVSTTASLSGASVLSDVVPFWNNKSKSPLSSKDDDKGGDGMDPDDDDGDDAENPLMASSPMFPSILKIRTLQESLQPPPQIESIQHDDPRTEQEKHKQGAGVSFRQVTIHYHATQTVSCPNFSAAPTSSSSLVRFPSRSSVITTTTPVIKMTTMGWNRLDSEYFDKVDDYETVRQQRRNPAKLSKLEQYQQTMKEKRKQKKQQRQEKKKSDSTTNNKRKMKRRGPPKVKQPVIYSTSLNPRMTTPPGFFQKQQQMAPTNATTSHTVPIENAAILFSSPSRTISLPASETESIRTVMCN